MSTKVTAMLVTAGLGLVAVLADYFLKRASAVEAPFRSAWFAAGLVIYASTAFGTVFVFRHLKLATSGVVYAMSLVLLLAALGVIGFRESITVPEVLGIAMAVGSLLLLARFA